MNPYLKLKIFIFCLIAFTSSQTAFSYTFFVETSQFNDDVYIIENVVSDKENQSIDLNIGSDQKDKDNVVSKTKNISQTDKDDNFIREYETKCTNLKSKPLLNTTQMFKRESRGKGLSLTSFNNAIDFWNDSEARDSLDNCYQLNKDHLFKTVSSLQKILLEKNYHNSLSSFPKIYSFDKDVDKKLEKIASKSEERYLQELLIEASNLRKYLLNDTKNNIIFTHYYYNIREKSQHQNRAKAMQVLRTRLYDLNRFSLENERADTRKQQVGTGDRSERIRTYNFPQGRVTDHRINFTMYKLEQFLSGDLNEMLQKLIADNQAKLMSNFESYE